jgi:hypothetical protein
MSRCFTGLLSWLLVVTGSFAYGQANGDLHIHFMDVGHGDGEVFISPNGEVVLFDDGKSGNCDKPVSYLAQLRTGDVLRKDAAAVGWCETSSQLTKQSWKYIKIPQKDFQSLHPNRLADLSALQPATPLRANIAETLPVPNGTATGMGCRLCTMC